MINKIFNSDKQKLALIFLSILTASTPIFLFGSPGFYGDDFNMLSSLEIGGGIIGSTYSWIMEYGIFYRPFGSLFLNSVYSIFGHSDKLIYTFSLAVYSLFIFSVFRLTERLTHDDTSSIFVTLFFASFPFNATAFLQISSVYMMFTGLSCILLMKHVFKKSGDFKVSHQTLIALLWLILLLSYEQITGLVAVIFLVIFFRHKDKGIFQAFLLTLKINGLIILATILFMALFFLSSSNPKVKTISILNQISQEQVMSEEIMSLETNPSEIRTNAFSKSRLEALSSKVIRSTLFLAKNLNYSLAQLQKSGFKGSIVFALLLLNSILILLYRFRAPSRDDSLRQVLFGSIWVASSLAPFFLYKSVHIPPYVLLIPSVGLAFIANGIFWLLPIGKYKKISSYLFKAFLVFLITNFHLQQYGYYFGLKEELSFWNNVAAEYSSYERTGENDEAITIRFEHKNNEHIFWIGKLVGERYFSRLIGKTRQEISIILDKDTKSIIIKDNS